MGINSDKTIEDRLKALTARQKEILRCCIIPQSANSLIKSYADIAQELGIQEENARKQTSEILKKLKIPGKSERSINERQEDVRRQLISLYREHKNIFDTILYIQSPSIFPSEPNIEESRQETKYQDFHVYKQEEWVGREEETDRLLKSIKASCRVVVILGITGIGKTALAERIVDELRLNQGNLLSYNFDYNLISSNTSFMEVAKEWLRKLDENIPVQEQNSENILLLLADKLCHNPYVILINSLEYILTGNEDMGWGDFVDESWNKFFLKILSAESCQSRFILTSQDLPLQLQQVGGRYPNFVDYLPLKGLEETKQIELFQKQGLDFGEEEQSLLSRIGKAYMGHPLALQVIAGEIKIDFHGSVIGYWESFGSQIEEVEKSLEEAAKGNTRGQDNWQLDSYSRKLKTWVKNRLEITFERLKNNAYVAFELICKVSVYRRPEEETAWLIQLEDDYDEKEILEALDILKDRALVEITYDTIGKTHLLGLHNLIRSQALYCLRKYSKS